MRISEIQIQEKYKIICHFDSGEVKLLDLEKSINDKYSAIILTPEVFTKAQVGEFGEIYWKDMAEIKTLNGKTESCAYDISPEYAYHQSKSLEKVIIK